MRWGALIFAALPLAMPFFLFWRQDGKIINGDGKTGDIGCGGIAGLPATEFRNTTALLPPVAVALMVAVVVVPMVAVVVWALAVVVWALVMVVWRVMAWVSVVALVMLALGVVALGVTLVVVWALVMWLCHVKEMRFFSRRLV